ncbi:MBL fold metallo-hydrolase [Catellatospora sp. TT07R-123]|uniref:MBL fold metallo-hydrolase n=1 Tax=Catellatospora sp. TT07R-123 TaxID=2733863 RepID=UPI001BB38736|nr:MBL fold metallo-hydrolase [Catellatospora sp. TT07R-123]
MDAARFAAVNRAQLLRVIAQVPAMRAKLAQRHATALAGGHPLLRELTGPDQGSAERAAERLAADPQALIPAPRDATRPKPEPKPVQSVEGRRADRDARTIAEIRAARDQARGRLEWAIRERDAARRELDAAVTDRDEALAVVESLRAELDVQRRRAADPVHAATVLAEAIRPAGLVDADPRDRERARHAEPGTAAARLTAALAAGMGAEAFLTVLDSLRSPILPSAPAHTRPRDISLTPLGGGTDIGGSCMLVEVGDVRLLVDAGMRPRQPLDRAGPPDIAVARAGRLDAIVVTHAHNDHAGYVPVLVADDSSVPVLCTPDTAALLPTMWADSVKVFERARREGLPDATDALPPYGHAEAMVARHQIRAVPFGAVVDVGDGVTVELFPAGHILGAAGVVVRAGASRVVVTGDVSDQAQTTVPGLLLPDSARGSDLLVIESTYCRPGRSHRAFEVDNFLATVAETVTAGGRVLVPAFALGRAQEVALTLRRHLPDVPVLVDGMARQITRIYEQQTATAENPLRIFGGQVQEVAPERRRETMASFRRGVVITTSGMLTAGPAVQWARSILPDPSAALLLAGHQDEESPGAALLALASGEETRFLLDTEAVEVKARIAKFGLSAHADRKGLMSIIKDARAAEVMLVHGLPGPQREFADHLERLGRRVAPTSRWRF